MTERAEAAVHMQVAQNNEERLNLEIELHKLNSALGEQQMKVDELYAQVRL